MPELTLKLSWEQFETLQMLAEADEILVEEAAVRAVNNYILTRRAEIAEATPPRVTDLEDHLLDSDEVMSLDI
jgi:hypothetical protein